MRRRRSEGEKLGDAFWGGIVLLIVGLVIYLIAMLAGLTPAKSQDAPRHSNPWLLTWIPKQCCVTGDCCWEVKSSDLNPMPNDRWMVVATGQIIQRKDWSPDGRFYRCACDRDPKQAKWIRHDKAQTWCVFVPRLAF